MQTIPVPGSTLLDRYYIEQVIDQHNDTAVLKAIDTRLDVPAVLKLLLTDPDSSEWENKKQNFIKSFRTQARLTHPNIVHVSDIESKGNLVFSVMELLQGQSLDQHLAEFTLTPKEVLEIFLGVIDAVAMGHSDGVCHLNISPRNILLNQQANRLAPRVLNFAYVRTPNELDPVNALPFTAPEMLQGFENATPASDVFSLCASIYYAFTKQPPIQFDTLDEYIQYYANNSEYLQYPEEIPASFLEILEQGLRTDPQQRFANANELLSAIKIIGQDYNLSANLTIEASPSGSMARASSPSNPSVRSISSPIPAPSKSVSQQLMAPRTPSQSNAAPVPETISGSHSQPIQAPSKSVSQQLLAPDPIYIQTAATITLPPSIAQSYIIARMDSVLEHACVCAIAPSDNPASTFSLKFLRSAQQDEIAAFNEAVQRNIILANENQAFQSIIMALPEGGFIAQDVPRQSLPSYIANNGPFSIPAATQLAIFIAQAMEYAHARGCINGNLKANNIIFENRNGILTPIIYDFAQKSYVESAVQLTIADIPYIAPDIDYNLRNSNIQSDIYSFGMIYIFMLLGRIPFVSNTREALIAEIDATEELPDLTKYRPDLPVDLVRVLQWCTAFEPEGRYTDFTRLLQDLYYIYNLSVAQ